LLSEGLEAVDPAVAHPIAELLLLPVQDLGGQERVLLVIERLPDDVLLDKLAVIQLHHLLLNEEKCGVASGFWVSENEGL
jgi:hypothetical protein